MSDGCGLSRREILAVAAGGVAGAVLAPLTVKGAATRPAPGASSGAPEATPVTPKSAADGWLTTVKPADIADNTFRPITDQPIVLARNGDELYALSTKCTHMGCAVAPQPPRAVPEGKAPELACPCHGGHFSLSGANTKGPKNSPPTLKPLARYPLRLNKDGLIEVNPAAPVDPQAPGAVLTLKT
ncbi:MAG TPA: Rieske (2Fe-2S) protein [Phycisphaerae bacterium]|nr:Rieske (2Fe-2S) protein [Phycisphaerae bacterium]